MSANSTQVGGLHYRSAFQHWDFVALYGLGYFEGQITKYTARHAKKHRIQDVEKAIHFTEKLAEMFDNRQYAPTHVNFMPGKSAEFHGMAPSVYFARVNNLGTYEEIVVQIMCQWDNRSNLVRVRGLLEAIRKKYVDERPVFSAARVLPDIGDEPGPGYVNQDQPERKCDCFGGFCQAGDPCPSENKG